MDCNEPNDTGRMSTPSNSRLSHRTNQMSASLKEKLRKLGRYHGNTPSPPVKSSRINEVIATESPVTPVLDKTEPRLPPSSSSSATSAPQCPQRRPNCAPQLKRKLVIDETDNQIKKKVDKAVIMHPARPVIDGELQAMLEKIDEREEELRKLRLVKLYRTKNNLDELEGLIKKWRTACQKAVTTLWEKSKDLSGGLGPSSIGQLLGYLRIDPDLVHYSTEDEDFY